MTRVHLLPQHLSRHARLSGGLAAAPVYHSQNIPFPYILLAVAAVAGDRLPDLARPAPARTRAGPPPRGAPVTTTALTPRPGTGHYRLAGVLRSEWTKLRTVRSAQGLCAGVAVAAVVTGAIFSSIEASQWAREAVAARAGLDPTNVSLAAALTVGQFAVGVLGVLCMTDEYSTGMIRSSLAAVPSRTRLLTAKAAVLALVTLLAGETVTFATFLAGQAVLESGKAPHAVLGQPGVLRAVALSGAYLALLALFGLGLGTVIRSSAGAVAAYTVIVLVLPLLLAALPGHPARFTPESMLTSSVAAVTSQAASHALPPGWDGLLLMAAYAAAALTAGGVLFARRDA